MGAQYSRGRSLLVLVLGITVLWSAGGVGGLDATVNQFTAYEVSHEDGELELRNVESGEIRRGDRPLSTTVDEEIVCLPTATRECSLARQEYDGAINSSGVSSAYRYAYLDDEFYRLSTDDFEFEFERTDAADAFAELSRDGERLTETERKVLDEGRNVVIGSDLRMNELLEDDGRYYTIARTGANTDSFCQSSGGDFCEEADSVRRDHWVLSIGVSILGVLGILVGGRGLLRSVTDSESSG